MKKFLKKLFPHFLKRKILSVYSTISSSINGKHVTGVVVKSGNHSFIVASDDMSVGRELRQHGAYGRNELNRILHVVSPSSSVIFVGAHIGAIAIPIAKHVDSCIFFEANPDTFKLLDVNLYLNGIENTKCHNIALGEKSGEINFLLNRLNSGGSKREPVVKSEMYYHDKPEKILVPMETLDSISQNKTQKIDLIFMDIEGSEIFALRGGTSVLKRTQALIIEFIPHHITNVANCTVNDFIEIVSENFTYCYIPSKNLHIPDTEFQLTFAKMYERNEHDDGVIFTKRFVDFNLVENHFT